MSLNRKILVAEDNEINQKLISAILQKNNYEYTLVTNGQEALEHFRSDYFDLILMDCQMPELDGLQASIQIRRCEDMFPQKRIPIIALTANSMKGDRENCLKHEMDDFLSKPFKVNELLEIIRKWIK